MARNIAITAGSGTTTAADEVTISATSVKVQEVKLAVGKVGAFVADQSGRLVDGTSDEAAAYVDPRIKTAYVQVASTGLTTAVTTYASGDMLGNEMVFASAARASAGSGRVRGATLIDKAKVLAATELWLFDRSVTPAADNAANAFSDADALFWVGTVFFPAPLQSANNYLSQATSSSTGFLPMPYRCNSTSLYGYLVTRSANGVFGAVGDIVISLFLELD